MIVKYFTYILLFILNLNHDKRLLKHGLKRNINEKLNFNLHYYKIIITLLLLKNDCVLGNSPLFNYT